MDQSEGRIYLIGVTVNKTFDKVVMVCCQVTIETNPSIGFDLLSFNQITLIWTFHCVHFQKYRPKILPRIEQSPSSNGGVQSALAVSSVNSEITGLPGALGLSITLMVISVCYRFKTVRGRPVFEVDFRSKWVTAGKMILKRALSSPASEVTTRV